VYLENFSGRGETGGRAEKAGRNGVEFFKRFFGDPVFFLYLK